MSFKLYKYELADLVEIKYGKNQKKVEDENGEYPILGTGGVMGYANEYLYDKPSVLIGRKGSISKVKYIDAPFWTVDTLFYTKVNEELVIPKYLYYVLSVIDFNYYNEGTTIPSLRTDTLNSIVVSIPNLEIQKKQLKLLDILEEKLNVNENLIKNLETLSQQLFKRWFINFEFPNEQGLPYRSSGGEMVESELGEIPKGWEVGTSGELFEFSPTVKLSKGTEAPFVEMKNLNSSAMIFDWINREFTGSGSKFKGGDTLLARITPCLENGKIGYVDFLNDDEIGWGSTEFISIRSKDEIDKTFSYFFANSKAFKDYAVANMNGSSGRQRVKAETLAQYAMPIPPFELIQQFTNVSSKSMKMMTSLKKEIISLQQLRDTLLPKLLSGEIEI